MGDYKPKSMSVCQVILYIIIPLWLILVPICLILYVFTLPLMLYRWTCQKKLNIPMKLTITECKSETKAALKAKDEILFIHGWPDSGDLWKR